MEGWRRDGRRGCTNKESKGSSDLDHTQGKCPLWRSRRRKKRKRKKEDERGTGIRRKEEGRSGLTR